MARLPSSTELVVQRTSSNPTGFHKGRLRSLRTAYERGEISMRQIDTQVFNRPTWGGNFVRKLWSDLGIA